MRLSKSILILVSLSIFLSACSPKNSQDNSSTQTQLEVDQSKMMINDILKGDKLIALANHDILYLVDPDYARPVELYQFKPGEAPVNQNYDNFKISSTKQYILWYTPQKGLISLNIDSKETQLIEPSTDFFNTYPYFEFTPKTNMVNFIVKKGYSLKQYDLDNQQENFIDIPYPYGNVFKVSPDEKSVLFVSGYGQNRISPKFMYSDISGNTSRQFKANINIFDRNRVFWAPDSSGVILINQGKLDIYPIINPDEPHNLITLPKNAIIESVSNLGQYIFILDDLNYWHVYDYYSTKEIARTPNSIAKELQFPLFIPWTKATFLMEEKIRDGDLVFNRLWVSDFRGNKKIIFQRYNETTIHELQPTL